jgi:hypothetical protein
MKDAPSLVSGSNKIQRTNSARTLVEFELNVAAEKLFGFVYRYVS